MTSENKRLYRLTIPRDSQQTEAVRSSRNIVGQGAITSGVSPVEPVSVQPGEKELSGQYRGNDSDRLARQLKELFDAKEIESVAFFNATGRSEDDGYYALGQMDTTRPDARQNVAVAFDGRMTKEGTRQSHYRSHDVTPIELDTVFGNTQEATIGVPADATVTLWYDSVSGDRQVASPDSTVEAEAVYDLADASAVTRDVDLFDANANPYGADGVLLYDLPYDEEGRVDCGVWDTLDVSNSDDKIRVVNSLPVLNWQRVFVQDHDFGGNPVIENGRFHIEFDIPNDAIIASEWNSGTQSWDTVSTGTANGWSPFEVDLTFIGEASVRAQVLFEDTDDGTLYPVNFELVRGKSRPIWSIPENETDPFPSDLQTYLSPIADDETIGSQSEIGLIQRSEVRK